MVLQDLWDFLEASLLHTPSTGRVFNPYHDEDSDLDCAGAASTRKQNLRTFLDSYSRRPCVLAVAVRASGKGFRFTGVPFVSEAQIRDARLPAAVQRLRTTSRRPPVRSLYDAAIWRALEAYFPHFIGWNCIPLQLTPGSHEGKAPDPDTGDILAFSHITQRVVGLLSPRLIVAIGGSAAKVLRQQISNEFRTARSPVYDTRQEFPSQMARLFSELGCPDHA